MSTRLGLFVVGVALLSCGEEPECKRDEDCETVSYCHPEQKRCFHRKAPRIVNAELDSPEIGQRLEYRLQARDGVRPLAWEMTEASVGLDWLDVSKDGILSGLPL